MSRNCSGKGASLVGIADTKGSGHGGFAPLEGKDIGLRTGRGPKGTGGKEKESETKWHITGVPGGPDQHECGRKGRIDKHLWDEGGGGQRKTIGGLIRNWVFASAKTAKYVGGWGTGGTGG